MVWLPSGPHPAYQPPPRVSEAGRILVRSPAEVKAQARVTGEPPRGGSTRDLHDFHFDTGLRQQVICIEQGSAYPRQPRRRSGARLPDASLPVGAAAPRSTPPIYPTHPPRRSASPLHLDRPLADPSPHRPLAPPAPSRRRPCTSPPATIAAPATCPRPRAPAPPPTTSSTPRRLASRCRGSPVLTDPPHRRAAPTAAAALDPPAAARLHVLLPATHPTRQSIHSFGLFRPASAIPFRFAGGDRACGVPKFSNVNSVR
jgi:hypothetical protein